MMTRSASARARLVLPLCLIAIVACVERNGQPRASDEQPVPGGTAVIAASNEIDAANPLVTRDRNTQELLRFAVFLPLLQLGEDLSYEPLLAESWTQFADTIEFRIRRDVVWHDGVRTTAHDVAFTFARAMDPETAYPNYSDLDGWGTPVVVDSFTVRFPVGARPDPLSGVPFLPVVPRHLLGDIPAARMAQAPFNRAPVGNGPFRFVETRANDRWVFEANPDFPEALGGRPLLDRLVWRVIPDGGAQLVELQTGRADMVLGAPVDDVIAVTRDGSHQLFVREGRQYGFIGWNARRPPLDDARVRRALAFALDRQEMIDALRAGHGTLASGPLGRWHRAWDEELAPLPFLPDSARTLLDLAGLRDVDGDGYREDARGRTLRIELKAPANDAFNRNLAEMIIEDLRQVGIRVAFRPTEMVTLIADLTSPRREFDAALMGWETGTSLDFRDLFHSSLLQGQLQFAGYASSRADSALDAAAAAADLEIARAAYRRLHAVLRDEQPWTFLYFFPDMRAASRRLAGVEMDIRGSLLSLPRWWLRPVSPAEREPGG